MTIDLSSFDWTGVVQLVTLVLSLIGGIGTVKLVQKLKMAFNLKGRWVQLLTASIATLFAILTLIVQGVIAPIDVVTVDYLIGVFAVVLTTSQAEYARIKRLEENPQ